MRTAKILIRLGGCPDWFKSSLGVQDSLLILPCGGSYVVIQEDHQQSDQLLFFLTVMGLNPYILHFEPYTRRDKQRIFCIYTVEILLYMKPLYACSILKLIAFWQNVWILHDAIFYFCLATVSSTSVVLRVYNTGKYTRLAIGLYFCTVDGWI